VLIDGHVKFRFVQRIMGIKDVKEINRFISNNEYEVNHRIFEFVNQSELLISNYAPTRKETLDYFVNGEVLIVMRPNKREIETLYYITLDTEDQKNSIKIKEYVKKIRKNNNLIKQLKVKQKKQNLVTDHLEYMIEYMGKDVDDSIIYNIKYDMAHSINVCKDLATQEKAIRDENRELMSEMFVKLDKKQLIKQTV
jgi:hypothetical protein